MFARFDENEKTATRKPPLTKHKLSDFRIGDIWWCYFPWSTNKELKDYHPAIVLDQGKTGTTLLSLRTTHDDDDKPYNSRYELPVVGWREVALDRSLFVLNSIQDDVDISLFTKEYIGRVSEFDWERLKERLKGKYVLDKKPGRRLQDEER